MNDHNPYSPPAAECDTSPSTSRAPKRRRMLGLRHLCANVLLFVFYSGVGMLYNWVDVRVPSVSDPSPVLVLVGYVAVSAYPVTCVVNWRLTCSSSSLLRFVVGVVVGLAAIAIGFVPYCVLVIEHRLWIGGSL